MSSELDKLLSLPAAQRRELDRLLDEFDADGHEGRPADEVMREVLYLLSY